MFTFLGARNSAQTGVMPAPLFPAKSGVVSSGGVGLASGRAGTPQSVLLASRLTGLALLVVAVMLAFKDPTIRGALLRATCPVAVAVAAAVRHRNGKGRAATRRSQQRQLALSPSPIGADG